jgi:hypothetical protein
MAFPNWHVYADKIHDLANLAIAALVFGQLLGENGQIKISEINRPLTIIGFVIYCVLTIRNITKAGCIFLLAGVALIALVTTVVLIRSSNKPQQHKIH